MAFAKMGYAVAATTHKSDQQPPAMEIEWEMLDKSRFFFLGAALFSGVSAALYPAVVLKTRLQVSDAPTTSLRSAAAAVLRREGPRGFYRGLPTSLAGTIPARALYMAALETTKSAAASASRRFGVPDPAAAAISSAAAGVSSAAAAQLVWTPVDVVSQRLMVAKYQNALDAVRKILLSDGVKGLYRGFGLSIFTYAPSNAVWWATYSMARRWTVGDAVGPAAVAGQGASAALAAGAAAVVTMPLDTVKTRIQVRDGAEGVSGAMRSLLRDGGWSACYRGLGPRWAVMSLSAATMATTYEYLKKVSLK